MLVSATGLDLHHLGGVLFFRGILLQILGVFGLVFRWPRYGTQDLYCTLHCDTSDTARPTVPGPVSASYARIYLSVSKVPACLPWNQPTVNM